jgi:hypothetical protein
MMRRYASYLYADTPDEIKHNLKEILTKEDAGIDTLAIQSYIQGHITGDTIYMQINALRNRIHKEAEDATKLHKNHTKRGAQEAFADPETGMVRAYAALANKRAPPISIIRGNGRTIFLPDDLDDNFDAFWKPILGGGGPRRRAAIAHIFLRRYDHLFHKGEQFKPPPIDTIRITNCIQNTHSVGASLDNSYPQDAKAWPPEQCAEMASILNQIEEDASWTDDTETARAVFLQKPDTPTNTFASFRNLTITNFTYRLSGKIRIRDL